MANSLRQLAEQALNAGELDHDRLNGIDWRNFATELVRAHSAIVGQSSQSNLALEQKAETFRLLFENHPHPMWVFDTETLRFLSVNNTAITNYGYSREEFLGMTIADIRPPEEIDRLQLHVKNTQEGVQSDSIWRHRLKDGRIIHVEIFSNSISFDSRPARLVLAVDVTKRVETEAALRKSEARLRTILDAEPECVKIVDRQGLLVNMNSAGLSLVEADNSDEVIGKPIINLIHQDDRALFQELHNRVCDGQPGRLQYRIVGLKGAERWMETHSTPLAEQGTSQNAVLSVTRDITHSKQTETALAEAERRFRAFMDHCPAASFIKDGEGRYLYVNRAWLEQFESPPAEWFGKTNFDFWPEETARLFRQSDQQSLTQGRVVEFEEAGRRPGHDEETYWLVYKFPLGNDSQVGGMAWNITDRKLAERALQASEEQYRTLLDRIPDPMFVYDRETLGYLAVNEAAVIKYGYSRQEFERMTIKDIRPKEDLPRLLDMLSTIPGGYQNRGEWRHRKKDGTIIYVEISAHDITLANRPACIILARDVTKRKRAEDALRASEQRLQFLAKATNDAIWEWDLIHDTVWWSEGYEELFGYKRAEVMTAESWTDYIHPEEKEAVVSSIMDAINNGSDQWSSEYRFLCQTGHYAYVLDRGHVIRNSSGEPVRMIGGMTDLTKIKQVQEDLARSNQDLQQFAYIASHDLQEPLRAVSGCIQLLQKRYVSQLDSQADELIQHAVDGALRMQTLINDLLSYSRVSTQQQGLHRTELNSVMLAVLANLETAIRDSSAIITYDPMPTVLADAGQMTVLFQNLLANAMKFRRVEPPRVHIGVKRLHARWQFSVQDNGIGMEPEYFDRVFVLFQRLHTRSEYPGTGIGLAVCKKVVERHGGQIWVESTLGKGTTFHFTLQALEEPAHDPGRSPE